MAIVTAAAHKPRVARPGDARGLKPGCDGAEEIGCFAGQMLVDARSVRANRLVALVLAVEDPKRIPFEPVLALLRELAFVRAEIIDECIAPGFARLRVAERVEFQRHSIGDPQLLKQLIAEAQDFDVRLRLGSADDLGVELMEFAKAAL